MQECDAITELCLRSKAHWGYDAEFMDLCRVELTVTPATLKTRFCRIATDNSPVGYVEVSFDDGELNLEKLFVDPGAMRRGIGRILMDAATGYGRSVGAGEMVIEADPDAVPFYQKLGAVEAGEVASGSIPGRTLPRLVLDLMT